MSASSEKTQRRSTVAVIGLGSIGGVAAGCLIAAGRHDVVRVAGGGVPDLPSRGIELALGD